MLLQLVANQPEAIVPILRNTPAWVWGLLAGLLALGLSQLRERTASLVRVSLLPLGMSLFSLAGTLTAFGGSPHLASAIAAWMAAGSIAFALAARGESGAQFDPLQRSYRLPGSSVPLLLILGIFLVKYGVGVELAMAPRLVHDAPFTLAVAALYGAFSGIFIGRAARLWRLALRAAPVAAG